MPVMAPGDVPKSRVLAQPQRALLTPSASPSVGPPDRPRAKRPRLRSTPSSAVSATPSTSNETSTSADVNSARRASTLRVLNTWAQLAERYNKRLDEDDIIDLHRYVIVKDRGAVESASREYHIGHLTLDSDQDDVDADQDQDQEDSEQEDDDNELNALPPSETTTDDDAPISKKELLRGVPPLSTTTDAEDLREFLEAEKRRREFAGDDGDEEEMSTEQRAALRKELEERLMKRKAAIANQSRDVVSPEQGPEVDATPTRHSTRVLPSDDESEDELALWAHDESTAVYPIPRDESEQDVQDVEQEVIELTDSDSDAEFEALLTHPPRFTQTSPLRLPQPREVQPPLQSPPNSERASPKPRARSRSKLKPTRAMPEGEHRPRSPFEVRKPEVILTRRRKPLTPKETGTTISENGTSDTVVACISPSLKGKGKESSTPVEDNHREKTPKSLGVASPGRKRKRIASSLISGTSSAQSPVQLLTAEPKSTLRSHRKSVSQISTHSQPDDPEPTLDEDVSTPARSEPTVRGHTRLSSSFSSASRSQPSTLSVPACRSSEADSVQQNPRGHSSDAHLHFDLPTPTTHPFSQRHPSHPPSIFPSSSHGAPGLSLPAHPPPPLDPAQAQQAHYLLAQAMHQLSYLLSATMPYTAYASNPGQPWHSPHAPPPPHTAYSTPIYHPPHAHDARRYHTPSSSISCSGLPPSSPVRSSMSPPLEEPRARSRGRSRSRGRRVSFKLDSEETIAVREYTTRSEPQHNGQKNRKAALEVKREKGKGRAREESGESLRLEGDRGSPPREVTRGRTPGPPDRKKIDVPRGRSLDYR